jgi:hypothetical protein
VPPRWLSNDAAGFASRYGPLSRSPYHRAFDTGLRRRAFPPNAASLLPGLLAATRTGLPPASDDELTNDDQPPTRSTSALLGAPKRLSAGIGMLYGVPSHFMAAHFMHERVTPRKALSWTFGSAFGPMFNSYQNARYGAYGVRLGWKLARSGWRSYRRSRASSSTSSFGGGRGTSRRSTFE